MRKRAFVVASLFLSLVAGDKSRAQNLPPHVPQPPAFQGPVVTDCWTEAQYFSSLRTGELDYCRGHMKYVPGALDCYAFETKVCEIFDPLTGQWQQVRQPVPPRVFECPDEAKPPMCPSTPALRR